MRSLLEKAIVHLLNGDQGNAEKLFHKFMVERAREIHESLRQNEDIQLTEGWDTEIQEEEYFDDLGDDEEGVEGGDEAAPVGDEAPMMGDEMADVDAADADAEDADADAIDADDEAALAGDEAGHGDIEAKLDDIEAKMDELSAEFDRLMGELDGGADDLGGEDDLDGMDDLGGEDDLGDGEDLGDVSDMGGEGESDDLADRMEDDLGDEDQPEHEMAEDASMEGDMDDEMMEDITESVLAELDKVAMPSNTDGKEIGSGGKSVSGNHSDSLPHHPVTDRVNQAKPYMVKAVGDAHNDSFERETPPSSKEVKRRRNNAAGVKKLERVPDKGDKSAKLNTDFTAIKPTKLPIDGSRKVNS